MMQVTETPLSGALILEPRLYGDDRGFFYESWNERVFWQVTGLECHFVQDNHSRSEKGVLRGLHYQLKQPQGKLVRVINGQVLDVVVDLRRSSATFGQHFTVELSAQNHKQFWVPTGFAHGFIVLSEYADFLYKTTDYYMPEDECCISWNDPVLGIDWQLGDIVPKLSDKDRQGIAFDKAPVYP